MRGRKEIIMNSHTLTSAHITAYARFLLDEERASATVEKYIRDIRSFASWLEGREVSKDTVVQWKSDLLAQDKAPSTVNGKLSALNGLFGFLG
jgi:integrase/recombinase XerD